MPSKYANVDNNNNNDNDVGFVGGNANDVTVDNNYMVMLMLTLLRDVLLLTLILLPLNN